MADSNCLQPRHLSEKKKAPGSLHKLLFSFCRSNNGFRKIIVVSYPYFPRSVWLATLPLLLKPFGIRVIVDVQDLPREIPWTRSHLLWWIVDRLYYLYADFIVNATECAKLFTTKARGYMAVIPMAAHHNIIIPGPAAATRNGLTLGYIGTVSKSRGFPEVINVVKNLRMQGLAIDLVINGPNPENIDLGSYSWLRYGGVQPLEQLAQLLRTIDVGLIPYLDREYWGRMSITKMATYMAAGIPILCLELAETSSILAKWNCGISVQDWDGMTAAVKKLYDDKSLVQSLGQNALRAALEEYNWAKQVQKLKEFIETVAN